MTFKDLNLQIVDSNDDDDDSNKLTTICTMETNKCSSPLCGLPGICKLVETG